MWSGTSTLVNVVVLLALAACDSTERDVPSVEDPTPSTERRIDTADDIASLRAELEFVSRDPGAFVARVFEELAAAERSIDRDIESLGGAARHAAHYKRNVLTHLEGFERDLGMLEVVAANVAPVEAGLPGSIYLQAKEAWLRFNAEFTPAHLVEDPGVAMATRREIDMAIEAAFDRLRSLQFADVPR